MKLLKEVSIYGILTGIVVFVMPFVSSRHLHFGAVNAKYFVFIALVSLLAFIFSYVLWTKKHSLIIKGRYLLFLLGTAIGVLYLSSFLGIFPERSLWSDIIRATGVFFITYTAFLSVWSGELLSIRDWSFVRRVIVASSTLIAFLSFLGSQGIGLSGRFLTINLDIPGVTLANETFAGTFLLFGFIFALIEFVRTDKVRIKYVLGGAMFIHLLSPLLLNVQAFIDGSFVNPPFPFEIVGTARASSIALILAIVYFVGLVLLRRFVLPTLRARSHAIWAVLWLVVVAVLVALLFVQGSPVRDKYVELSTEARVIVGESGVGAFKERPLLGWGPENFRAAFQHHFDNRLYLEENLGEIWFDRAHNLFIDILVSVGVLGLLAFISLWSYFILVVIRATRAGVISILEGHLLGVLVVGHLLQLQTAFNTPVAYIMVAVVLGYGLFLERTMLSEDISPSPIIGKAVAAVLIVLTLVGSSVLLFSEYDRQKALFGIFTTLNEEKQLALIDVALDRTSNFEALRLGSASLVKGLFESLSAEEEKENELILRGGIKQLKIFSTFWKEYIEEQPDDYRARINYAYQLLIISTLGGEDRFDEAKEVIAGSYALSPENPLTPIMDGLASLYSGDVSGAIEKMEEAIDLNPDIVLSHNMLEYVEKQALSFPDITVIRLENI